MDINYFDIVAASIILLLGLKGILNGFFKEVFGLVGIIGGLFIASRLGDTVGTYINDLIFHFQSPSAVSFAGFIATLAVFWLIMIALGTLFKKLSILSGLGIYDKILGFVFGASKFFLIAAVIAHAAYNIKAVRSTLDSALQGSVLFPIMVETGGFIMKIDPVQISDKINDKTQEILDENLKDTIETMKKQLKESK
jgi:membrane protein required for colicin V production